MQIAIKSVANVPESQVVQMLALHRQYYSNVTQEKFFSDFREKTWCIVVADDAGQVQGYSTLQLIPTVWNQAKYYVLFSGNTLMNQAYWNLNYIAIGFSHMSIYLLRKYTDTDLLWLLISMHHRTYRFLPTFFRRFYPSYDGQAEVSLKPLLDHVCRAKFGSRYDAERGVIVPSREDDFLTPEMAETAPARRKDPHVAFFLEKNPGAARGEELACLAPLSESNVHTALLQRILRTPVTWMV
jgi:hypothetical protein